MTDELVLANARLVLDDGPVLGAVLIRDGLIADLDTRGADLAGHGGGRREDLAGDFLMPGVVELHTDHVEYHLRPRPGVHWDALPALLAHDAQMTAAGATTVLDAVRLGSDPGSSEVATRTARELTAAIGTAVAAGLLRAEHGIHLRCEVSAPDCQEHFEEFADSPLVQLASLMDHTPGQRQFADLAQFQKYFVGKGVIAEHEVEGYVAQLREHALEHADRNRRAVAEGALRRHIDLAAHDDATFEQVGESASFGVGIAEFPTTVEAATAARQHGMTVVMGAPNLLRGGSQSGNVAAAQLLDLGLLDILSSDYVPSSPLQAVFQLVTDEVVPLEQGVRLLSTNPARAIGLTDRGRLGLGLRADVIRVRTHELPATVAHPAGIRVPVVREVYRHGERVA